MPSATSAEAVEKFWGLTSNSLEPLGRPGKKKHHYQYAAIDDCTHLRVPPACFLLL